tara:strand:+ start:563 stop:694 length:132 start_codon:yes stop_codon:yes gene_type:complete
LEISLKNDSKFVEIARWISAEKLLNGNERMQKAKLEIVEGLQL